MSLPVILTDQQEEAVTWVLGQLHAGISPVAIRGYAGCGKTTLVPTLRERLGDIGLSTQVGSPTHRAAMVLKKKGITDATTVHSHALTPYFDGDYTQALTWLGGECQCRPADMDQAHPAIEGVPWLIYTQLDAANLTAKQIRSRAALYGAKKALESLGISGKQHFSGFGPKRGAGVLILDEASMVGAEMLTLCQQAFPLICLIGDPGQLPPVRDVAQLATVPGYDLTQIHRQAADSPILQLAYQAREGQPFWHKLPRHDGQIEAWRGMAAATFLQAPLIVWRNATRLECTAAIRAALGYPRDAVQIGEPLVCRSTSQEDRAEGLYNNGLFRVVALSGRDPRRVTVQAEGSDDTQDVLLHLEELHGHRIDPEAVPFRFGFCLTAHTAQGGEWHSVYLSLPDLVAYAGFCQRKHSDDIARWSYTAITRAKACLGFLTQHHFERTIPFYASTQKETPMPTGPTTAPMLTMDPFAPTAQEPLPASLPDTLPQDTGAEDIADPPVPPGALQTVEAHFPEGASVTVARAFCEYLQGKLHTWLMEEHSRMATGVDVTLASMRDHATAVMQTQQYSMDELTHAMRTIAEQGLMSVTNPYKATVKAVSTQGYVVSIEVVKRDPDSLIASVTALTGWLKEQQYGAMPEVAAFD